MDDRRERGSLDAWGTICALSSITSRIRLGTLVSPVTFRHPSTLAKSAVTADHVSGGRIELGMGAGWWEPEHELYGFPFPPTRIRMELLAEQLEIVRREWGEGAFSFHGDHYRIEDLDARPKPVRRPNLIIGGSAGRRSATLAARWADEYNTVYATPELCRERRGAVAAAWEREGRDPETLRLSVMTGCLVGADSDEVTERARRLAEWRGEDAADPERFLDGLPESWIVGTPAEASHGTHEHRRRAAHGGRRRPGDAPAPPPSGRRDGRADRPGDHPGPGLSSIPNAALAGRAPARR